jgi:putative salt-induced outer membrane protein YdiY
MISLISLAILAGVNPAAIATDSASLLAISNPPADASTVLAEAQTPAAATPAAPAEPKWTGSVTAGAILTSGNSDSRNANASADGVYQRTKDRFTLGFLWNYAEDKSTGSWNITDRKTSGRAKYDYFLSEKTYALAQASAEADEAADLDLRTTIGVGVGRQVRDDETWKFGVEGGLSQIDENYGSSPDSSYLAARGAYNATWNFSKMWQFAQLLEIFPSLEYSDDFNAHVDTRAKATLTESMFGQLQWVYDFDNTPATGHDRVDNRLVLSVGWKF